MREVLWVEEVGRLEGESEGVKMSMKMNETRKRKKIVLGGWISI